MKRIFAVSLFVSLTACASGPDFITPPDSTEVELITFVSVAVGGFHACGITTTGEAKCWGANRVGQLGNGTFASQAMPLAVADVGEFLKIATGDEHTCGTVVGGVLYCWGADDAGQLGLGQTNGFVDAPVQVPGGQSWSDISAGARHTCGIAQGGDAFCWGVGESGQLGNGADGAGLFEETPQAVLGGLKFQSISAGAEHTCGVTQFQEAYCWGSAIAGQLGTGNMTNALEPALVSGGLVVGEITAGAAHSCAISLDGKTYCWGQGQNGELGNGTNDDQNQPVAVAGPLEFDVGFDGSRLSSGPGHTCALDNGGIAYCWGANGEGQLGDGSNVARNEPGAVTGQLLFGSISVAGTVLGATSCGITSDRILYCWGEGLSGRLGNGLLQSSNQPVEVSGQNPAL